MPDWRAGVEEAMGEAFVADAGVECIDTTKGSSGSLCIRE
jgi:hypothetical protein